MTSNSDLDWLRARALVSPNAVAFENADSSAGVAGDRYTYGSLYYLTCRLATKLESDFAIKRGDRICILSINNLEYVALFFAIQRLGAIMVPINYRLTAREIDFVLNEADAKLLIVQNDFAATVAQTSSAPSRTWPLDKPGSGDQRLNTLSISTPMTITSVPLSYESSDTKEISVSEFIASELELYSVLPTSSLAETHEWSFDFRGEMDDACMILYTSGTTGVPKGALITNKMLHWNSLNTGLRLNLTSDDIAISYLPFFHTSGWNVLVTPFVHRGGKTILIKKFNAERVLELTEKENVTIMFGVPTNLDRMSRAAAFADADLKKVRYAVVGGEPMPIELIHTWQNKGVPIRQGYGLTEFGPSVFSLNEEDAIKKIGSIGTSNRYVEARIIPAGDSAADSTDEDSSAQALTAVPQEVPTGEVGELILRGPVCTPGYWRNSEATALAIKDGWFHTGDLVRRDTDGCYFVVGRKKDMYISGGENVYPIEVENHLRTHPAIREVAVIGTPDTTWGEVGKAFISLKPGFTLSDSEVITHCHQALAKYKTPKQIVFLADLPKTPSGKISKRSLQ